MGTRSLTHVFEGKDKVMSLYRQYNGYPGGHGQELAEFLHGITMVNGISLDKAKPRIANGMGCLAAQLVVHFKTEPGGFYLHAPSIRDAGQDYEYEIHGDIDDNHQPLPLTVKAFEAGSRRKLLFEGDVEQFMTWTHSKEVA